MKHITLARLLGLAILVTTLLAIWTDQVFPVAGHWAFTAIVLCLAFLIAV